MRPYNMYLYIILNIIILKTHILDGFPFATVTTYFHICINKTQSFHSYRAYITHTPIELNLLLLMLLLILFFLQAKK